MTTVSGRLRGVAAGIATGCLLAGCGVHGGDHTATLLKYPDPTGIVLLQDRGVGGSHRLSFVNVKRRKVSYQFECQGPGTVWVYERGRGLLAGVPSCAIGDAGGVMLTQPVGVVHLRVTAPARTKWTVEVEFGNHTANVIPWHRARRLLGDGH